MVRIELYIAPARGKSLDFPQSSYAPLSIQIVEDDFPAVREVDLKLIELAKVYEGKIITNDLISTKWRNCRAWLC